jgi:hypothetical protein
MIESDDSFDFDKKVHNNCGFDFDISLTFPIN